MIKEEKPALNKIMAATSIFKDRKPYISPFFKNYSQPSCDRVDIKAEETMIKEL